MRQDIKTVAVMYIETALLMNGIGGIVKGLTQRSRPFVYNADAPLADKLELDARESFFSVHSGTSFATAVFTGEVFQHYFPQSKLKPFVWIGTLGLEPPPRCCATKPGSITRRICWQELRSARWWVGAFRNCTK